MANFFKPNKAKNKSPVTLEMDVEHYNHDGDGIAYVDGKICFVQGALPGERVKARLVEQKAKVKKAHTVKVVKPHANRIKPSCGHFEQCGGCQLQYIDREQQLTLKQQAVTALFNRFGKVEQLPWQQPLAAEPWQYRRAARIGVWYERKSRQYTVGFRKQNSKQLTSIDSCPIVVEAFADVFKVFSDLLPQLACGPFVTHLEIIHADNLNLLVVRHTKPLNDSDKVKLQQVGEQNNWLIASEAEKGEVKCLDGSALPTLNYHMPDFNTQLAFRVGDFVQVNGEINRQMVNQARQWLSLNSEDCLLDLFCGIGNFSLPLASICKQVVGVEGVDAMVKQAEHNATLNNIENAEFYQADLSEHFGKKPPKWLKRPYNKILLDPARAGAEAMMLPISRLKPEKVLYVSCDPLTCARDSGILLEQGYQLEKIALMDMFSHTRHVEVMALFSKK